MQTAYENGSDVKLFQLTALKTAQSAESHLAEYTTTPSSSRLQSSTSIESRNKLEGRMYVHSLEMQIGASERRKHCALAVVRRSQKNSPRRRPPSRGHRTAKI